MGEALASLVGDGLPVPCVDDISRPYLHLDAAASSGALPAVAARVAEVLPTRMAVDWRVLVVDPDPQSQNPAVLPTGGRRVWEARRNPRPKEIKCRP